MTTGVYCIRHIENGRLYIGSTTQSFQTRWSVHKCNLEANKHHSVHLQRAWTKYGSKSFVFEVLEECDPALCLVREQYFLDTLLFASSLDSRFHILGYNIMRKACGCPGINSGSLHHQTRLTDETVKAIKAYLASGWFSQMEIADIFEVSQRAISDIHTGKRWSNVLFSVS
jgi:group I intron endonuclease